MATATTLGYNPNQQGGALVPPSGYSYIQGTDPSNGYSLNPLFLEAAHSTSAGADTQYNPQATNTLNQNLSNLVNPVSVQNQNQYYQQNYQGVPQVNGPQFFSQLQQNMSALPQQSEQNLTPQLQQNIGGASLDTSGLNALQSAATQSGPSAWLQNQLALQKTQQGQQMDQANQGAAGAYAGAVSQLENQGGLTSGANENLARQSMMNGQLAQQGVQAQGQQTQEQLQVQDEANKNAMLQQLPGAQLNAAQYGLSQANASNAAAEQQQGVNLQTQQGNQSQAYNVANALNTGVQNQASQDLTAQQANQNTGLNVANNLNQLEAGQQNLGANVALQNNQQGLLQAGLVDQSQLSEQSTSLANAQDNRTQDYNANLQNNQNLQNVQSNNINNNLNQVTQQNAANVTSYGQQLSAWAAAQTGQAQANSGKK